MDKRIFFRALWALGLLLLLCNIAGCQAQQTATTHATPTPSDSRSVGVTTTPSATGTSTAIHGQTTLPRPDHVVVVMEENHAYSQIIGSASAPYLNTLAAQGASFTNAYAITHPSEPNYLALFSGSTQGVTSDACPVSFSGPNLASALLAAKDSFGGYSENLPSVGFTGCVAPSFLNALYARKHNPWVSFTNVPASVNMPLTSFPADYSSLPTISFVIPNQLDDMHSGSVSQADSWLKSNLDGYVQWAKTHNSLLIVTWDEDDGTTANQIPTLFVGQMVKPGQYSESINHYSVLRTLEAMYGLPYAGASANVSAISDIWQ
jgi:phospholipase C